VLNKPATRVGDRVVTWFYTTRLRGITPRRNNRAASALSSSAEASAMTSVQE
jgi:hypothetical protein